MWFSGFPNVGTYVVVAGTSWHFCTIFAREIKSSAIAFAETIMGLHASISSLKKLLKSYFEAQRSEDGEDCSIWIQIEEVGQRGSKCEAHAVINSQCTKMIEKCACSFRALTAETCFDELTKLQVDICLRTARNHLRDTIWRKRNLGILIIQIRQNMGYHVR